MIFFSRNLFPSEENYILNDENRAFSFIIIRSKYENKFFTKKKYLNVKNRFRQVLNSLIHHRDYKATVVGQF
jgi:hypothetical protein